MINKLLVGIVIIIVVALIGFFISTLSIPEPLEEDEAEENIVVAENWIQENAATFTERGGTDLEYIRTVEVDEGVYEITFEFEAAFAGYGELEEDEMAAQVITTHSIVVTVENGEVVSAITDRSYDEMEGVEVVERETIVVDLYFVLIDDGVEEVSSVQREFPVTEGIGTYTLERLLEGPTEDEKDEGYSTSIQEETTLNSLHIEDGVAYADFSSELDVSGSAWVTMVREQIENTLLQFESIDDVVISIEGETEDVLQP